MAKRYMRRKKARQQRCKRGAEMSPNYGNNPAFWEERCDNARCGHKRIDHRGAFGAGCELCKCSRFKCSRFKGCVWAGKTSTKR